MIFWEWHCAGISKDFTAHFRKHPVDFLAATYIALPINVNLTHWFLCLIVNSTPTTAATPDSSPTFCIINLNSLRQQNKAIVEKVRAMLCYLVNS